MFELLRDGPRPVGELAEALPVSRPAVSQHLKVLKDAGLVRERVAGTKRFYSIDTDALADVRAYFEEFWDRALASFKEQAERRDG